MRADARRNRERILEHAASVLSTSGPAASMEEIAQAVGVGVGTLYRHFPDKPALLDAIGARTLQAFGEVTAALVADPTPDGDVVALLHRYVDRAAADATLRFALAAAPRGEASLVHDAMRAHRSDLEELIARDTSRGLLRPGIDVDAFRALCAAVVLTMDAPLPDGSWRTVAAVVEDGLRAPQM
ncbi:TetR/AcrR family transcriptional regulator [Microbacterium dextranolyticum]|uniref:TetR family transcriptional regulator n=1 Tax=Microbacterium dextranolyticum TaxID=36806 RepID=A0A9W6HP13_9MICO|nr:TetR/AcrR family transcriptional regulator [Microbacterium dextranolyticum]MBM7463651.1 AcrR family transcriptional regulator [Microbacterium dextranolyticum]GLJ96518.1 TetR family transcriptional regulator [Microbacterium dextranolyticum]